MLTVYGQPNCQPCRMAEYYLQRENVPYTYVDLSQDQAALARMKKAGHLQTPIIQTPTRTTSGFNVEALKQAVTEVQASTAVYTDDPSLEATHDLD